MKMSARKWVKWAFRWHVYMFLWHDVFIEQLTRGKDNQNLLHGKLFKYYGGNDCFVLFIISLSRFSSLCNHVVLSLWVGRRQHKYAATWKCWTHERYNPAALYLRREIWNILLCVLEYFIDLLMTHVWSCEETPIYHKLIINKYEKWLHEFTCITPIRA